MFSEKISVYERCLYVSGIYVSFRLRLVEKIFEKSTMNFSCLSISVYHGFISVNGGNPFKGTKYRFFKTAFQCYDKC